MTNYTQTANVMDTISFTCNVTGFPYTSIQIRWIIPASTLDDRIEISTVTNDDYVVSTLTVKSIQLSDAGLYKCMALTERLVGNILFNLTVGMYVHITIVCICMYVAMTVHTHVCVRILYVCQMMRITLI